MATTARTQPALRIPTGTDDLEVRAGRRAVALTNLRKVFWPEAGYTKGDLLQYYADVSIALLQHPARGRFRLEEVL
jgi:bifunctional non-homologous end joining protein LigD